MPETLWNIESVVLRGSNRHRLDHISCTIESGVTAILGSSGAGKTSLLSILAGMETPDSGTVDRQFEAAEGGLPLYWAPQGGGLWPHLTVRQHLTEVGKDDESADKLLVQFDLLDRQAAFPAELSQGERARISIARALAVEARVLLFDEPLVHVDGEHKTTGWQVIRHMVKNAGIHLVLTTHEPDVVLREAGTVLCLDRGRLAWNGSVQELYECPPDAETGRFLGPLNWFEPTDQARWLAQEDCHPEALCLRPERLQLRPAHDGAPNCEVVESQFMGQHADTTLRRHDTGDQLTVSHRPARAVRIGDRVSLTVLCGLTDADGSHD